MPDDSIKETTKGRSSLPDISRMGPLTALIEGADVPHIEGYKLLKKLGQGGMGVVWQAVQYSTKRPVALKILAANLFGSETSRIRFEREIELSAKLEHPNIARIYDSGVHRGQYYYAMEFIEGLPLDVYVSRYKLDGERIMRLMLAVCGAVQHAHSRGVIHRDLKPSNILVSSDSQPHVLDFGLAKWVTQGDMKAVSRDGEILGTLAYMAPEQAAGEHEVVGTHSDVYSLGVILYGLLVGGSPHDLSGSDLEILRRIAEQEPVRPRSVNREIDREVETILLKALSREPARRYSVAGDLARDINSYLDGEPLSAKRPTIMYFLSRRIHRYRGRATVAAILAVVLIVFTIVSSWRVVAERNRALIAEQHEREQRLLAESMATQNRRQVVAMSVQQGMASLDQDDPAAALPWLVRALNTDKGDVDGERFDRIRIGYALKMMPVPQAINLLPRAPYMNPRLFLGGKRLVVTDKSGNEVQIFDASTGEPTGKSIPLANRVRSVEVSADGLRMLVSDGAGKTLAIDCVDGRILASNIDNDSAVGCAAFAADPNRIFTLTESGVARLWEIGDGARVIGESEGIRGRLGYWRTSTDGKRLTVVTSVAIGPQRTNTVRQRAIQMWSLETGKPLTAPIKVNDVEAAAMDSQGDWILLTLDREQASEKPFVLRRYDAKSGNPVGEPLIPPFSGQICQLVNENRLLVYRDGATVRMMNLETQSSRIVATIPETMGNAVFLVSNDGKWILLSDATGAVQLWDTGASRALTPPLRHESHVDHWQVVDDGKTLVTYTHKGVVRFWNVGERPPSFDIRLDGNTTTPRLISSGSGSLVGTLTRTGLNLWDANTRDSIGPTLTGAGKDSAIVRAVFLPDAKHLAAIDDQGIVRVWALPGLKQVFEIAPTKGDEPTDVASSPDGSRLVTAHPSGARLWDARSGAAIGKLFPHRKAALVQLSTDGTRLATASRHPNGEQGVKLWNVSTPGLICPILDVKQVIAIAFSEDSKLLLTGEDPGVIKAWNAITGAATPPPWESHYTIYSPTGRWVAHNNRLIASDNVGTRLLQVDSRKPLGPALRFRGQLTGVALASDGTLMATTSTEGARIWEVPTGLPLSPLIDPTSEFRGAAFTHGDRKLLLAQSQRILIANIAPGSRSAEELTDICEATSPFRISENGTAEPLEPTELKEAWFRTRPAK